MQIVFIFLFDLFKVTRGSSVKLIFEVVYKISKDLEIKTHFVKKKAFEISVNFA